MEHLRLAEGEYRFARIVWENEPLPSGKLVELSQKELGWKKSTTYTVLKKLVERGILRNENAVVTAAVPQEDILREESRAVVDRAFEGSLPSFLAHFMGGKTISNAEADELKALIDRFREEDSHA
ncbi:MAG: BlaI/MecI/CopY family transcriptional regulator [Oscillospiraceae bacterium]|jgi:BlaI family penicillinase repressor|nr:BlaI/MecI/CopY family transcriptional regulator [Oscillospiraceae bacterium]MDE6955570.1 BlaI/MecI/CopY family transcriptional regulator [Oscillospiraceae bacterium]